jgi:hypothetical protein
VGVVNALVKGEMEDHVWFKDRLSHPEISNFRM